MRDIKKRIVAQFGNQLRVRVCGICLEDEKILLINHHSLNDSGDFWSPPGGGMDYSESAEKCLKREFQEETGIEIEIDKFLFVHEYLHPPLHAIELFFLVNRIGGVVGIGHDPEMGEKEQIIKDVKFMPFEQIKSMNTESIHQVLTKFGAIQNLTNGSGYFLMKN